MEAIQIYESSDSEEEHQNYCVRKVNTRDHQKGTNSEASAIHSSPQSECHSEPIPSFKGYSSYLHLEKAQVSHPVTTKIYGITKKEKEKRVIYHNVRNRVINKTTVDKIGKRSGHQADFDSRCCPPPNYLYSLEDASKTSLQTQKPMSYASQSYGTSSGNQQPQHQNEIQGKSCQHHDAHSRHKSQTNQRNLQLCNKIDRRKSEEASLIRKHSTSGLKPYVPKRLRFITEELSGNSTNKDEKVGKTTSDMFNIDPYIATERSREVTISKPPKRVLCNFNNHKGPATCVQWNIPQYSHLLLSSSMDKTVRLWDYSTQRCVQVLCCHEGAVKDAQWSSDGLTVLSCGFDKTARLSDAQSGTNFQVFEHPSYVTCVRWHPQDPQMFISGTYGSTIYCWDTRTGQIAHEYSGRLGQILALEFINHGTEFVASCDTVSRDSADRTIMVWDTSTPALVSNQLYHEKYTCTSFKAHPTENIFMAQSNANYIALFSTKRPYRLNKYKRFEGHQIEGYHIGCDFSPDGSMVVSGGADGQLYVYNYASSALIRSLGEVKDGACIDVAWHPVLPSIVASCGWDGVMSIWR